jgi:hypothetical protein
MQKALDIFQEYWNLWKLSVNSSKTKVIVFSRQNYIAKLNGAELEIVDSPSYLSIVFKYSGNIFDARKKLVRTVTKVIVRYLQENTKLKYTDRCSAEIVRLFS